MVVSYNNSVFMDLLQFFRNKGLSHSGIVYRGNLPFSLIMACVGLRKSENHMTLSHYWKTLGNDFELWRYPSCNEKGIIKVYSKKNASRFFFSQILGELHLSVCHQPLSSKLSVTVLEARNLPKISSLNIGGNSIGCKKESSI